MDRYVRAEDTTMAHELIEQLLHQDFLAAEPTAASWLHNITWYGPPGVGSAVTSQEYIKHWLQPLRAAFTERRLEKDVVVCEALYCGAHVRLYGRHTGPWLGVQETGQVVSLRLGLHWRVDKSGRVAEGWCQVDLLAAFAQMGHDLLAVAKKQAPNAAAAAAMAAAAAAIAAKEAAIAQKLAAAKKAVAADQAVAKRTAAAEQAGHR